MIVVGPATLIDAVHCTGVSLAVEFISRLISRVLIVGSKGPGHPDHGSQFPR